MPEHLMGVSEIAELLGLTRQRVHQIRQLEGFPEPTATIAMGPVWLRVDVETWAHETGRLTS
ncbi:DNA-binding protein [Nocardioides sp.]|uniref:helix-turn-helix transcriptional regulator n=1 Tax=Nocardioides sp. TaxID=35761 RepID=UPI002C4EC481|nr:DNA-binding protein [Nocardioides sp.]HXH80599.1 DNA-binding protein [Nocardioides sp.]